MTRGKTKKMQFDIQQMLTDLGGASNVARRIGVGRSVPYGWVRRNFVSSVYLSKIKEEWPALDLDHVSIHLDQVHSPLKPQHENKRHHRQHRPEGNPPE